MLKSSLFLFIYSMLMLMGCSPALAQKYLVGPGMPYSKPSDVAKVAQDHDVVEITAREYVGDVAVWRQNNLIIRGVGGRPHLMANGQAAQGKAIWVIKGNNTTIENIEFSGARVADQNGAGIRQEGANLTVKNCYFHQNENGILAGEKLNSTIIIKNSIFDDNGYGDGESHNIYIGQIKEFSLLYSYVHHARIGHNVKSRAHINKILYNRLMDEQDGTSSYIIDLPDGGASFVIGNLIQQGPLSDNSILLSYSTSRHKNPVQSLYVVNNTFVNDRSNGVFIRLGYARANARLVNNIFAGRGKPLKGTGTLLANLSTPAPGFVNRRQFDYRLRPGSPAIDAASPPGAVNGFSLQPIEQYVHVAKSRLRKQAGRLDIGAIEYIPSAR